MHLRLTIWTFALAMILMLQACSPSGTPEREQADEPRGDADPAELVFLFQKQRDPLEVKEAADQLAQKLGDMIGIPVRYEIPTQYSASVQALVSQKADIAYVSSIPYLLARRDGNAEILVVEERADTAGVGRTEYDSVLVVRKDSPLQSYDDLVTQASDLRISFTSTQSTSGYVMPYRRFVQSGIFEAGQEPREGFAAASFAGSYDAAVREVLADRADVATVSHYVVEGDRATNYLTAEELEEVRILERIPGVPTHLVCARAGISEDLKERIQTALLQIGTSDPELLADVYGAKKLVLPGDEDHVATAAEAIEMLGIDVRGMVQ